MTVAPVIGENLMVQRAGRVLLAIPYIELASDKTRARCTVIVGPNGAGKSVLVRCLCALLIPDEGIVTWGGEYPDSARRRRVGLILQKPVLLKRSAQANLVYALCHAGADRKSAEARSLGCA